MPNISKLLQAVVTGVFKPEQIFYLPSLVQRAISLEVLQDKLCVLAAFNHAALVGDVLVQDLNLLHQSEGTIRVFVRALHFRRHLDVHLLEPGCSRVS